MDLVAKELWNAALQAQSQVADAMSNAIEATTRYRMAKEAFQSYVNTLARANGHLGAVVFDIDTFEFKSVSGAPQPPIAKAAEPPADTEVSGEKEREK